MPHFPFPRARRARHGLIALCVALAVAGTPGPARAHGAGDERIAWLEARIEASPSDPDLLVARAALRREAGSWDAALEDLDRAERRAPGSAAVALERARVHRARGAPRAALRALTPLLTKQPDHTGALVLRARALRDLGRHDDADVAYARALAASPHPSADLFLERVALLREAAPADAPRALAVLDQAVARLGPLPALVETGVEIELARGRPDAALASWDAMPTAAASRAFHLARRGELLERAARPAEARAAFTEALAALATVPRPHRLAPARRELAAHLHASLARLGSAVPGARLPGARPRPTPSHPTPEAP